VADRVPRPIWIAAVVGVVFACTTVMGELRRPLNPDVAWLLYSAERVLRGDRLYVDILEINPPLIVWLNLPVAALARALNAPGPLVCLGLVTLVMTASCFISGILTSRLHGGESANRRAWVMVTCAFVLFPLASGMFGQREHLALAFILPLIGTAALRVAASDLPRPAALGIGVLGGLGMAIKPHYALVWLLLVAFRWWASGKRPWRWHPEDAAVLALGVAYPLAVLLLTPDYFAFVGGSARDYLSYGSRGLGYVLLGDTPAWWFYVALVLSLLLDWPLRARPISGVLLAAGCGFLAAVALQGKGWSYHYYPVNACAFLLAVSSLGHQYEARVSPIWRRAVRGLYAIFVGLFLIAVMGRAVGQARGRLSPREIRQVAVKHVVVQQLGAQSLLVISSQLRDAFPLVNDTQLRWDGGYPNIWIPLVYYRTNLGQRRRIEYRAPESMPSPERHAFERVVRDVVEGRPDILVVESRVLNERRTTYPGGFDFLAYFGQDRRFAAALQSYHQVADVDGLLVLRRRLRPAGS
jgi:hypothetical protein